MLSRYVSRPRFSLYRRARDRVLHDPGAGRGRAERQQGVERRASAVRRAGVVAARRDPGGALRDERPSHLQGGVIVIKSQSFRSQDKNRAEAIERLVNMVRAAAKVEKPRRATKPTRASQRRRVQRKVQHGEVKRLRGRVQGE
ncbi:peptide chain release factor-like protein [Achromobacter xylosoxidans]